MKRFLCAAAVATCVFLSAGACGAATGSALGKAPAASVSQASSGTQYYFPRAGQAPEPVLAGLIRSAKSSVDMAIYSFTDTDIANALIADEKRGVKVRILSDREQSGGSYQKKVLASLKAAGIPVKVNKHSGLMHLKVTVIDRSCATTGSFNYTKSAETENDEVFVVLNAAAAAADFDKEFTSMWNDDKKFKNY